MIETCRRRPEGRDNPAVRTRDRARSTSHVRHGDPSSSDDAVTLLMHNGSPVLPSPPAFQRRVATGSKVSLESNWSALRSASRHAGTPSKADL